LHTEDIFVSFFTAEDSVDFLNVLRYD
jgi:hypothetical protein